MSLKELILYRIPQQFQYKILGRIHQYKKFFPEALTINNGLVSPSYVEARNIEALSIENSLVLSFFDIELNLAEDVNWAKDYKNNISSSHKYYSKIDKQDFRSVGDIKYVFEPSRFYFLPFFALRAANDKKYLSLLKKTINDWNEQNPYLKTVHWTSGIEIGIRSVNLIYTHMVLSDRDLLSEDIDALIKKLIQYNYHYLTRHLSRFSSANNHLVAELTALVAISCYFDSKTYKKKREAWVKFLCDEIKKQVNDDGVNMELCTHYHAEVTDHFLNAILFVKRSGFSIPNKIQKRFLKMFDFLEHVEYRGLKTIFGDNDEGALIQPFGCSDFSIYRSLLQSAFIGFNKNPESFIGEKPDLRNYLIFGDSAFDAEYFSSKNNLNDKIFKKSGYAFFYDHSNGMKISFDFGDIGDDISAAHGHSDIFHFNLDLNGESILIDSGTYQYHKRFKTWRSYFRGVHAHNTISVNNKDHAEQATRMSWINRPTTVLISSQMKSNEINIEAQTDAYKADNYLIARRLHLRKKDRQMIVTDSLKKQNKDNMEHLISFNLNFGSNVELEHTGRILTVKYLYGEITILNDKFRFGKIIDLDDREVLGWRSNKYNEKFLGQVFRLQFNSKGDETLTTTITYG